jgi:hypothetical protein
MIFHILFIKLQPARLLNCFILAKAGAVAKSLNGDFGKSTSEHTTFFTRQWLSTSPLAKPVTSLA